MHVPQQSNLTQEVKLKMDGEETQQMFVRKIHQKLQRREKNIICSQNVSL